MTAISGMHLRLLRQREKLSQHKMAKLLKFNGSDTYMRVAVSRLERGERPMPAHVQALVELMWLKGVPEEWLKEISPKSPR